MRSPIASIRGVRRLLAAPLASVHGPVTGVAAPGNHRAPTPTRRRESIAPLPSPLDARRSNALGVVLARMVRLALGHSHRPAGNRHCVAPFLPLWAAAICFITLQVLRPDSTPGWVERLRDVLRPQTTNAEGRKRHYQPRRPGPSSAISPTSSTSSSSERPCWSRWPEYG